MLNTQTATELAPKAINSVDAEDEISKKDRH
jgi:hypothetical protein